MWISTPAVLRLVAMMAHCFALGKAGSICLPTESLSPNREEVYDPSEVGTDVTMTPVCTQLTEPRVQVTVQPSLHTIITWINTTDEKFFFGYVCGEDMTVARNFSRNLPRGIGRQWSTLHLGHPQSLALGDTCSFFGCYQYTMRGVVNGTTFKTTVYTAKFNDTSCIMDLDECSDGSSQCGQDCVNVVNGTANSYQCTCRQGFSLSEDQHNCTDVDECAMGVHTCDQICNVSTDGWYNCSCRDGFTLDQDEHTCNDIDECLSNGTVLCDTDRTGRDCTNTPGSYQCTCRDGFQLDEDQLICVDIDECGDDTAQCQQLCHNTEGSYNCSCSTWYSFVGPLNCTEIDVCTELAVECGGHSKCMNMPEEEEGYSCVCDSGYEKNGLSCSLIGIVHVRWVVPVLLVLLTVLILGCVSVLRQIYLKKHDIQKRYNILFKYQMKKEEVDPSYSPLDLNTLRKVSYTFSLISTLETYECPSYPTIHETDDEKDYEPSCNAQLHSPNGHMETRDEEHAKRELSEIAEDNEDGMSIGKNMKEFAPEIDSGSTEAKYFPSCVREEAKEDQHLTQQDGMKYINHSCFEGRQQSDGYIEEPPHKYGSLLTSLSGKEGFQVSCSGDRMVLTGTNKEVANKHSDKLTQSEPYAQLNLPITSVGILQTSPYLTEMDKEQCPLCEPPANSRCSLDMLETDPHMMYLSTYPTGTNTALNDGYIPSDSSTASSGYASVASYKSHLTSTSNFATDESVAPKSSYIPSNLSTASSSYTSESGVSIYQCDSVASQMSCGTPQIDYVTDTSLCGSPVALRKIPEVSGYVTESLEPVLTHSLAKHSVDHKHSEDTIHSAVCIDIPDAYVDSDFNEDQYIPRTGSPSTTHNDLDSERAATESDCDKRSSTVVPLASSGYIPYPGQDEAALHDHSDNLSLGCEVCYTQEDKSAPTCRSSDDVTSSIDSQSHSSHNNIIEENHCSGLQSTSSHLNIHNDGTLSISVAAHLEETKGTLISESSFKSGYIDPSQLTFLQQMHN